MLFQSQDRLTIPCMDRVRQSDWRNPGRRWPPGQGPAARTAPQMRFLYTLTPVVQNVAAESVDARVVPVPSDPASRKTLSQAKRGTSRALPKGEKNAKNKGCSGVNSCAQRHKRACGRSQPLYWDPLCRAPRHTEHSGRTPPWLPRAVPSSSAIARSLSRRSFTESRYRCSFWLRQHSPIASLKSSRGSIAGCICGPMAAS